MTVAVRAGRETLADFDAMVVEDPENAWAHAHRGEARRQDGDAAAALADFERALEIRPDYAWAHAHQGLCFRALGRYRAARACFDRALDLNPENAWARAHRANLRMALADFEGALTDADRALAIDPRIVPHSVAERALILNALGRFAETRDWCATEPDDVPARYSLLVAVVHLEGIEATRKDVIALRDVLEELDQTDAVIYRRAGLTALLGEDGEALALLAPLIAVEEYRELAKHDPAWSQLWDEASFLDLFPQVFFPARAKYWFGEAMRAKRAGGLETAARYLDRADALLPDSARILAQRGELARQAGHFEDALADFDRALAREPDRPWTLAHRGAVYRMLHRFDEAAADFERALTLKPDYAWALGYRALIHEFQGEVEACYRLFEETVKLRPALYPDRHGERALLLCRLGRFDEALQAAETAGSFW